MTEKKIEVKPKVKTEAKVEDKPMVKKLETIGKILSSIQLNLKVSKEQNNKFGNYKYRKAEDILEAYKIEVKKDIYPFCDITTPVEPVLVGGRFFMKCTAILESAGDIKEAPGYAELEVSKKGMDLAQLTGAANSYAKKYALGNLFAIDDSKDDPDSKDNTKKEIKRPIEKVAEFASEENRLAAEGVMLKKLEEALSGFGSKAEIDGYLNKKSKKGIKRSDIITKMSDVNAAQGLTLIENAKLNLDPDGEDDGLPM